MKLKSDFLSRAALLWLLTAVIASLVPHVPRLPVWILGAAAVSLLWRFMMHLGRWPAPTWPIKLVLVIASFAGVYFTYGHQFSIESMVALLSAGAILKPLEAYTRRDTYVLIFLCYFLVSTEFLFDQSPLTALYVTWALSLAMTAQVSLNQGIKSSKRAHLLALKLIAQSIPLAVVLFLVVPRLAPLWSLSINTQAAVTGLSNSMTPGDIANLTNSDALAFRATFEGDPPPQNQLYWRALVMDEFDGNTWKPHNLNPEVEWYFGESNPLAIGDTPITDDEASQVMPSSPLQGVGYEIMLEPHEKKWLFGLDVAAPLTHKTGRTTDYRLVSRERIYSKHIYQVRSTLEQPMSVEGLPRVERAINLRLPRGDNPLSRKMSEELKARHQSPEAYVDAVEQYFLSQPYVYTLKPPTLGGDDSIDQFLFESQRGFCAHYAGSFTYLMRLGGVPARIVTGYQGGEFNKQGGYVSVYQFDAHAWVEIWLEGSGWVRYDPTSWVSPDRIEQGIQEAVKEEFRSDSFLSVHRYRELKWLLELRQQFDAFNYHWNNWVLSYTAEKQQSLLEDLFGKKSFTEYVWIIMLIIAAVVLMLAAALLLANREPAAPPLTRAYQLLRNVLRKKGIDVSDSAPPSVGIEHAVTALPHLKSELVAIGRLFDAYLYGAQSDAVAAKNIAMLKRRILKLGRRRTVKSTESLN